jgi:mRNA interferase MazF
MRFEPYDDVVVHPPIFPFTDKLAVKRQPALIISNHLCNDDHRNHLILAMITTAKNSEWNSDIQLHDWHGANLTVPCKVRFKLFPLDRRLVIQPLGSLSPTDQDAVKAAITHYLVTR